MSPGKNTWSVEPLGLFVLERKGGASISAEDFTDIGVPVLHKGSIQPGGQLDFSRDGKIHTSEEYVRANSGAVIDDRFVVATLRNLVRSGETLGFVAPIPKGRTFLLAQGAYGLRLDTGRLDPRYLSHLSNAWVFHREVLRRMVGTTQVHIRNGDFLAVPIPLPPLPEQRRIVEILDKADALRAKRRAALGQLDTLTQSIFLDMFGDPARNPKGFPVLQFAGACERIFKGAFDLKASSYREHGIPFIRIADIQGNTIDLAHAVYVDERTYSQYLGSELVSGDIVFSKVGTIDRIAVIPVVIPRCLISQNNVGAKLRHNVVHSTYSLALLTTPYALGKIRAGSKKAVQDKLVLEELRKLPFMLPPISLQREFARRVTAVEALKTAQRASLAQVDVLFATLQHHAFCGEL